MSEVVERRAETSLSSGRLAVAWALLVPLSVVVHELGHWLPVRLAGCPAELRFRLVPHVVWPVCTSTVDLVARIGGPASSLLLALLGLALQRRLRRTGLLLAGLGLFLPSTLAASFLFASPERHDLVPQAAAMGWPAHSFSLAFAVAGLTATLLAVLREPDRRSVCIGYAVGAPTGLLLWCLLGTLLTGRTLQ